MTSPSLVEALPNDLLTRILSFVSTVPDLLNCEKSCKALKVVLASDKVWENCLKHGVKCRTITDDGRLKTHREKSCTSHALRCVRREGNRSDNILLRTLSTGDKGESCRRWKAIVSSVLEHCLPVSLSNHHAYFLRGDTMGVVLEILEAHVVTSFQRAVLICLRACPEDTYPILNVNDLQLQDALGQPTPVLSMFKKYLPGQIAFANSLVTPLERDRIVRGAAFRAGVPRIDNEVYDLVWTSVVELIHCMFRPACEMLVGCPSVETIPAGYGRPNKRKLNPGETIRAVSPLSVPLFTCQHCHNTVTGHTPVPAQIEAAAAKLLPLLPAKVYNQWLFTGDSDDEIAAAQAEYIFLEDESVVTVGIPHGDNDSENEEGTESEEDDDDYYESSPSKRQRVE